MFNLDHSMTLTLVSWSHAPQVGFCNWMMTTALGGGIGTEEGYPRLRGPPGRLAKEMVYSNQEVV